VLTNLSFEIAGTAPGEAASWTWSRTAPFLFEGFSSAFGSGLSRFEGFELGWGADVFVDELVVPTNAAACVFVNGTPNENFETGWRAPNSHGLAQSGTTNPFGNVAPFALANGETLLFQINGSPVTATFNDMSHGGLIANIEAASAIEVVHTINIAIGDASITDGFAFLDGFGHVFLSTDETGLGASIVVVGGTAASALGFVVGTYQGGVNVTHPGNETAVFAFPEGNSAIFSVVQYPPNGVPFDGFERGWPSNEVYFNTFMTPGAGQVQAPSVVAEFYGSTLPYENFEEGWDDNEAYLYSFAPDDLTAASFFQNAREYAGTLVSATGGVTTLGGLASIGASYVGTTVAVSGAAVAGNNGSFTILTATGTEITFDNPNGVHPDANTGSIETVFGAFYENFESVRADEQVVPVYNGGPSYFVVVPNVFFDGDRCTIYAGVAPNGQAGIIPTGINPLISYFVVSSIGPPTNTFGVSLTLQGSAVSFTDNGSGVIMVKGDTGVFWTQTNVGI
jgi:hypothetical protein